VTDEQRPSPLRLAIALAWAGVAVAAVPGLALIIPDLLGGYGDWHGLGLYLGGLLLIPAIIAAVSVHLLRRRHAWARVQFTVLTVVLLVALLIGALAMGSENLAILIAALVAVLLVTAALLTWSPACGRYFNPGPTCSCVT